MFMHVWSIVLTLYQIFIFSVQSTVWEKLQNDENLKNFLGNLEQYEKKGNDLVFVLDESGSIGIENFPLVLNFTELIARQLSVSQDDSRLAAITYGSDTRSHIDQIANHVGENMCTFLHQLSKIDYNGGATHTGDAMRYAQKILSSGRSTANKLIVLLTDGQSNGGEDLGRVAKDLKASGIIIFVVGVAKVNATELHLTASSDHHVYLAKDFPFVVSLNRYLVNDTKEVSYDSVTSNLCNAHCTEGIDCCDEHANCYCGTKSGKYECACGAGFTGTSGYKGYCTPCPIGSYKSRTGNNRCRECPTNSTTRKIGCTSIADCVCLAGYTGYPQTNKPCLPILCNALRPPKNGFLIPKNCAHSYGTRCYFRCHEGYCPRTCDGVPFAVGKEPWHFISKESRTCLASGLWSDRDFFCEKVKCSPLQHPIGGIHNCTSQDTDFSFGTVCKYTCKEGYLRHGSEHRTCLLNGSWSGTEASCESINCSPLKISGRLFIKPKECGVYNMSYTSTCQYYCSKGFSLALYDGTIVNNTVGLRRCEQDGQWSNHEKFYCKDVEAPVLYCPVSRTVATDYGKASVSLTWKLPEVFDNVYAYPPFVLEPPNLVKPPHAFPIGSTKVVYNTSDWSGNRNTCSFTIKVIDNESPRVDFCPDNIVEQSYNKSGKVIKWDKPRYSDNSGIVHVTWNRKNGDIFKWGPPSTVNYVGKDPSGNVANCSFTISVTAYSCPRALPPVNGFLTCDRWTNGQLCAVSCEDGFEFPVVIDPVYFCSQRTKKWSRVPAKRRKLPLEKRGKFVFPWPDCSSVRKPVARNVSIEVVYEVRTCSEENLNKAKELFIATLKTKYANWCISERGCSVNNVNITCGPLQNNSIGRSKRGVEEKGTLIISYNIQIPGFVLPTTLCDQNCTEEPNSVDLKAVLLNATSETVVEIVTDATKLSNVNIVDKLLCPTGSVSKGRKCVNCPVGTYFNKTDLHCESCPVDTYQDEEASEMCKPCVNGSSTLSSTAKSRSDCKFPCSPGTLSETGFLPCLACPKGSYQEQAQSKHCEMCPYPLTTSFTGSHSPLSCVAECTAGTFSYDGFQPCTSCPLGTYQPFSQQMKCLPCMKGTTTVTEGADDFKYCQSVRFCEYFLPCANGSTCVDIENGYTCQCGKGFTGRHCDINHDDCVPNLCQNNGTCLDGIDKFTCACPAGFSGPKCEFDIDECSSGPCQNGICIDLVAGYTCTCRPGFSGSSCEINIDECASDPCQNGGLCFDMDYDFRCCCPVGYAGRTCEILIDNCNPNPCLNSGTCESQPDGYVCLCPLEFDGPTCENRSSNNFNVTEYNEDYSLEFSQVGTMNYVQIENAVRLREITVSFFMQAYEVHEANRGTPVSYSYYSPEKSAVVDNGFTIYDTNGIILYIHGEAIHTGYEANKDLDWHHYALTWESFNGSWVFYVDGTELNRGNISSVDYVYPGVFVLGQEQDDIGGGFSTIESFVGKIFEFNVWKSALSSEAVWNISQSFGFRGDFIQWTGVLKNILNENITVAYTDLDLSLGTCAAEQCYCKRNNDSCFQKVESCDLNPCQNNQTCDESLLKCDCDAGYEGRLCQYDVNECLTENGRCSHECTNTHGSHFCTCPENMVLLPDNVTCQDIEFCNFEDKIYVTGDRWVTPSCEECSCSDGLVFCERLSCSNVTCGDKEKLLLLPGQCCHKCVSQNLCSFNEDILETFDGMRFKFPRNCLSTLLEDRLFGSVVVRVENLPSELGRTLSMYESCAKIVIHADGHVLVNSEEISLPFSSDIAYIGSEEDYEGDAGNGTNFGVSRSTNDTVRITLHTGLVIDWESSGKYSLAVPDQFKKKITGLCGNLNDNPKDDMMNKTGVSSKGVDKFLESWKVDSYCEERTISKPLKLEEDYVRITEHRVQSLLSRRKWIGLNCGLAPDTQKEINAACSVFWSAAFSPCHEFVNPNVYHILCLKSACKCKYNALCFCNSIITYLMSCAKHNVHITDIGAARICSTSCPSKMAYHECGPQCPPTCNSTISSPHCSKWNCFPGCYCPEETVLHNGKCIHPKHC